jgi:hypothetical protein
MERLYLYGIALPVSAVVFAGNLYKLYSMVKRAAQLLGVRPRTLA